MIDFGFVGFVGDLRFYIFFKFLGELMMLVVDYVWIEGF